MGIRVPSLVAATTSTKDDIGYLSQGGVDKSATLNVMAEGILKDSDFSYKNEYITGNQTVPQGGKQDIFYSVGTGASTHTVTFQAAIAADMPTRVGISKVDTGSGKVVVTGLRTQDVELIEEGQTLFVEAQQISGTPTYAWVVVQERNLNRYNSLRNIVQPASTKLWTFSAPTLQSEQGDSPIECSSINHVSSTDANTKFDNQGVFEINNNSILVYQYTLGNAHYIKFRMKPKWEYDVANFIHIIDNRSKGGSSDNIALFGYDSASDSYRLLVRDDGSNFIQINSDPFGSSAALQQWTDFVITVDKANNDDADNKGNANLYINGVKQGGGAEGTKSKTGNGILNIDLVTGRDELALFVRNVEAFPNITENGICYFTDFLIGTVWNEDVSNHDGSGSVQAYYSPSTKTWGINHDWINNNQGDIGYRDLHVESINMGVGMVREARIPIGVWNMNTTDSVTITHNISNLVDKIITYNVFIFSDLAGNIVDFISPSTSITLEFERQGGISFTPTTVGLTRRTGGTFDNLNFDSTTVNRGWIYIKYLA